jgi:hypothetical protein
MLKGIGFGMVAKGGADLASSLIPGIGNVDEVFLSAPADQSILSLPADQSVLSGEDDFIGEDEFMNGDMDFMNGEEDFLFMLKYLEDYSNINLPKYNSIKQILLDSFSCLSIKEFEAYDKEMKKFEEDFQYIVRKTFSYFDTGKNVAENFYHAFTLGLLVNLDGKYRIVSNKESGDGRPDVIIIPKDNTKKGVIIEFKVSESPDENAMKEAVKTALDQIEKKKYSEELINSDIKEIIKIGIAFCGKIVMLDYKEDFKYMVK